MGRRTSAPRDAFGRNLAPILATWPSAVALKRVRQAVDYGHGLRRLAWRQRLKASIGWSLASRQFRRTARSSHVPMPSLSESRRLRRKDPFAAAGLCGCAARCRPSCPAAPPKGGQGVAATGLSRATWSASATISSRSVSRPAARPSSNRAASGPRLIPSRILVWKENR